MKFKTKIWMLPASAALVFIVGLVASLVVSNGTSATLRTLRNVDDPYFQAMSQVDRNLEQFRTALQSAASEGDPGRLDDVRAFGEKARASLKAAAAIGPRQADAERLTHDFEAYATPALQATEAMLKKADPGDALAKMQSAQATLDHALAEQLTASREATQRTQAAADRGVQVALWVTLGTGGIVLLVLGLASWRIVASVWGELGADPDVLSRMARHVAEGDLWAVETQGSLDDKPSLHNAMARMATTLRETVGTIRLASDAIMTASSEIAMGNQDLSHRTEQAASRLQETSSSMQQLTGTVRHSADAATQADGIAREAAQSAAHGGGIVSQVVASMSDIDQASRKIQEITGVIDGIAFQTNILALNAAVEAARAGDHGRGFAVVASEVRTLAQRSAGAAREIKSLIQASSERVDNGSRLVQDAGHAMQNIVAGVDRVTQTLGEITAATTEQSVGIGQVNDAVTRLDHMTQQNAALVEESAAATASLREQAATLAEAVARFKLQRGPLGA
jgi:methyl-accepting chemotaxis protein